MLAAHLPLQGIHTLHGCRIVVGVLTRHTSALNAMAMCSATVLCRFRCLELIMNSSLLCAGHAQQQVFSPQTGLHALRHILLFQSSPVPQVAQMQQQPLSMQPLLPDQYCHCPTTTCAVGVYILHLSRDQSNPTRG